MKKQTTCQDVDKRCRTSSPSLQCGKHICCRKLGHGGWNHYEPFNECVGKSRESVEGFNGSTIISLNEIVLPLSTGPIIVIVKFSVIEDPSPYNAILDKHLRRSDDIMTMLSSDNASMTMLPAPVIEKQQMHVCVDFTDLIEACPKDSFSLPRINQIVDAMAGHELLSFLDAFFWKRKKFEWDEQGDWVFATIKIYLASFPILNQPHEGERLYIYLAAISVARPDTLAQKVALVLHTMAKKLKPYFQEHAIVVLME
ncbi:hypothetical protein CK203_048869 [Vitis vinifera]|uniref:Uncharacterized protein n=1 Tax=Vitis vinifera TaxID=29760 RepID=A0A438FL14_VITVI|nr:hypothetical protein CK203_048869 [Vitis vinifera]